jgi:hypothetical protein
MPKQESDVEEITGSFIYKYIPFEYNYMLGGYTKMSKTIQITEKEKLKHSPTLNTVVMVEETLKKSGLISLAELKRKLPKQVMHQTLIQILDYLQISGKILIGTKGILWVFAERKELNELMKRGTEI